MALWTWVRLLWNSAVAAAMVAAAQLGAAYGLGIVEWDQPYDAGNDNAWSAELTWTAFVMVVGVLAGAGLGRRSVRRPGKREGFGVRLSAAVAAGVGAVAAIPLIWLPGRQAHPTANVNPELVVVITAGVAILIGVVVAVLALSIQPVAGNTIVIVVWAWALGIASATQGNGTGARLGVLELDTPVLSVRGTSGFAMNTMIVVAAVVGLVVALVARWVGAHRVGIAMSGACGPAVIAAAYLLAGPGVSQDHRDQLSPYIASLIAVGAGLGGSIMVAAIGRRGAAEAPGPDEPLDGDRTEHLDRPVPAPDQRPVAPRDEEFVGWLQDLGPGHSKAQPANGAGGRPHGRGAVS